MPLSLGYGLKINDKYNAVLLCKKCNNKKSSFLPTKFYTSSQLKILETTYDIHTHKEKYIGSRKNIDVENLIDFYEKTMNDKQIIYLDYLDYLWNQEKTSKYRLKKGTSYKVYYVDKQKLQIIYGEIKYNYFLVKIVINGTKISLKNVKGVILSDL